jgi:hypothetical protein
MAQDGVDAMKAVAQGAVGPAGEALSRSKGFWGSLILMSVGTMLVPRCLAMSAGQGQDNQGCPKGGAHFSSPRRPNPKGKGCWGALPPEPPRPPVPTRRAVVHPF